MISEAVRLATYQKCAAARLLCRRWRTCRKQCTWWKGGRRQTTTTPCTACKMCGTEDASL